MRYTTNDITAVIIAGGQGKRLGGRNKGLLQLNHQTFVALLLKKLAKQSRTQIISANNDLEDYQQYGVPVIKDITDNYQGPLSGIISCKDYINSPLVLTVPCDSPLIPDNLSQRLLDAYNSEPNTTLCVVDDGSQLQNLFMLFDAALLDDMTGYFQSGQRKVYGWIKQHSFKAVDFSDCPNNFINVNDENSLQSILNIVNAQ